MEAVGRGLAAAVIPALLSAAITRVLMRLVALLVGNEPHFDPFALLGIFVVYAVLLVPGCLALALSGSAHDAASLWAIRLSSQASRSRRR